jgi:glycerol-3-phosphate dehydrogenase (NAD(P)+)
VKLERTAILGAGGWGTALSVLWAKKGRNILLWGNNSSRVERLRQTRENGDYLPGICIQD